MSRKLAAALATLFGVAAILLFIARNYVGGVVMLIGAVIFGVLSLSSRSN